MERAFGWIICVGSLALAAGAGAEPFRVSAAISLREAMTEIAAGFKLRTGVEVELVFGSSGQLLNQVRHGAEVDVFIAASVEQVDALEREELSWPETRRVIAGNGLVLIAPASHRGSPKDFRALADPAVRRVAIGEPATVPAGQYAAQVLSALGLADALRGRLVYGTNVRQVLDYVKRGEVSAGIVYASDALVAGNDVRVIQYADPAWHEPIEYPAVILRRCRDRKRAEAFLEYLIDPTSRRALSERGFTLPQRNGRLTESQPSDTSATTAPSGPTP